MSSLITESVTEVESWELPVIGGKIKHKPPSAKDLEQIRQEAYKEGFTRGQKEGLASGKRQIAKQADYLEKIVQEMASPLEGFDEQLSHEVAELAIAMARQIIRRELRQEPGQVVAIAKEALAQLPGSANKITVTLHPLDAALLREFLPESDEQQYRIVENGATQRGGCMVEANNSRVDATVEKQISSVIAALFGDERHSGISEPEELDSEAENGTEPETP